jgi:ABC-type phosphate transport system substrate-binding protein
MKKDVMMKKRILTLAIALLLTASLILAIAGCSSSTTTSNAATTTSAAASTTAASTTAAAAPLYKLKYADQNPPTGWEGTQAAQPWLDRGYQWKGSLRDILFAIPFQRR